MKRIALFVFSVACCLAMTDIRIDNLKLYVDCEEFIIKGMCYNPVPLGINQMASDQTGGGGYCSPKETPFGEWKSACYDSDYFDGSGDIPNRYPAGPAVGWFQAVWERDFPLIKQLGINTLRLYNANPTTRQASIEQLGSNGISQPYGKDHIPFMDMADQWGFKVIFPLIGDQTVMTTTSTADFEQLLRNQIDEVGNHSALLMWNFSNELPLASDPTLVATLNKYIPYIRNYTMSKWGRSVPITTAVVDIPTSYDMLMSTLDVDIFSSNAGYRGLNFQDLWTGAQTPGFAGFTNLSRTYNKPLFISEMGWHQVNNSVTESIPNWFNQQWQDLVNHIDDGCIGGAFFEYSDEIYTKVDTLQQDMGIVSFSIAKSGSTNSDQINIFLVDDATPKDLIFASLQNGTVNGQQYNFNGDVYSLIGRSQTKLSACTPPPTSKSNPTSTSNTNPSGTTNPSTTTAAPGTGTSVVTVGLDNGANAIVVSWMMLALYMFLTL